MDIRKRKIKGIFVVSVLIILCLCVASVLGMFVPHKSAIAVSDIDATLSIGELTLDGYENESINSRKIFNRDNLTKLYIALTGNPDATYQDIVDDANIKRDSSYFYSHKSQSITLSINGLIWQAVYLSTNEDNSEPVLTLWLANYSQLPEKYRTSKWNEYSDSTHTKYPSSMYGTSKLRAVALNNGGKYANSTTTLTDNPIVQDSNNPFAIYTMSNSSIFKGSLIEFIDTPANISWQRTLQNKNVHPSYYTNFCNDSYATNISINGINYQVAPSGVNQNDRNNDYSAWKDDKIWVPAMSETVWAS